MLYKCLPWKFSSAGNDLRLITVTALAPVEWALIWPSSDNFTEEQQWGIYEEGHFNTMLAEVDWPDVSVESGKKLNAFSKEWKSGSV